MGEFKVDGDVIAEVVAYLNGHKTAPAQRMADAVLRLLNRHYQDAAALEAAREDARTLGIVRALPEKWRDSPEGAFPDSVVDCAADLDAAIDQARGKGVAEVGNG